MEPVLSCCSLCLCPARRFQHISAGAGMEASRHGPDVAEASPTTRIRARTPVLQTSVNAANSA